MKKTISVFLSALLTILLTTATGFSVPAAAENTGDAPPAPETPTQVMLADGDVYTVTSSDPVGFTSESAYVTGRIVVPSGTVANLVLLHLLIHQPQIDNPTTGNPGVCAFDIEPGATVNLWVIGDSSLESSGIMAGLHVPPGATLNLYTEGVANLSAKGGDITSDNHGTGAGIGGHGALSGGGENSGPITLVGTGTVRGTGGAINSIASNTGGTGAGIGGGGGSANGNGGHLAGDLFASGSFILTNAGGNIDISSGVDNNGGSGAAVGGGGAGTGGTGGSQMGEIYITGTVSLDCNGGYIYTTGTHNGGTGAGIGGGGAGENGDAGQVTNQLVLESGIFRGTGMESLGVLGGLLKINPTQTTPDGQGAAVGSGGAQNATTARELPWAANKIAYYYADRAANTSPLTFHYLNWTGSRAQQPKASLPAKRQIEHYAPSLETVIKYTDYWYGPDPIDFPYHDGDLYTLGELPAEGGRPTLYSTSGAYAITVSAPEHGSLSVSKTTALGGEPIPVQVAADKGYWLRSVYYLDANNRRVEVKYDDYLQGYFLIMPDADVTLYAVFEADFTIEIDPDMQNGRVRVRETTASPGDYISVTLRPEKEFEYDPGTLYFIEEETGYKTFIDPSPFDPSAYYFKMPQDNITIYAEFRAIQYEIAIDENIEFGMIDTDVFEAAKGQTVTVSVFPDATYQLIEGSLTYQLGNKQPVKIQDYQFEMPSGAVELTAEFERKDIYILEDHLYDKDGNQLFDQEYIDENGDRYYFDADGNMLRDTFRTIENSLDVYYYNSEGKMLLSGWLHTEDSSYYFGADGKMLRGSWLQEDENHYYFGEDGLLCRDVFIQIGEYWYCFDENGVMAKDGEMGFPSS